MAKRPFRNKKDFKTVAGHCHICGEKRYELLDVHRVEAGSKYSYNGTVSLCNRCHRLHHSGIIHIEGWYNSTAGRLLRWFDENGTEHFS